MTDEKIIEVMAEAARRALMDIEAVWLAAWIKRLGPDATLDHSDQTELHRIRQRLWEATDLTAITAAGYEIVEKGQAEAVDEREALAMRLAKAEALAEAAKEVEQIVSSRLVVVRGVSGEPEEPGDNFTRDVIAPLLDLRAALSAFQQGGDGWRPVPEGDEDAKARGIEYPPSDVDLLLWSQPWGHDEGTMEVGFWHNSRGGSIHSTARFWRPLPAPPRTPS